VHGRLDSGNLRSAAAELVRQGIHVAVTPLESRSQFDLFSFGQVTLFWLWISPQFRVIPFGNQD